jgi:hypothetical protein
MSMSVIFRLVEAALADGELVGEIEVVETGERRRVKGADEIISFLRRTRPRTGTLVGRPGSTVRRVPELPSRGGSAEAPA